MFSHVADPRPCDTVASRRSCRRSTRFGGRRFITCKADSLSTSGRVPGFVTDDRSSTDVERYTPNKPVAPPPPGGPDPNSPNFEADIDWRVTLLCFLGPSLGGLLFGYDVGATSGALVNLTDPVRSGTTWFDLTPLDRGEIVSLTMVGACIASFTALILQDRLGRRRQLILAACCYGLASATMAAAPNEATLLIGRTLYGIGIGLAMHGAPAYIAETVPQGIRGLALTTKEVLIVVGITLGYTASATLSPTLEGWRWIYALSSVAAAAMGTAMLTLPESPRWALLRGEKPAYARRCLQGIRRADTITARSRVNRELGAMYLNVSKCKRETEAVGKKGMVGMLYRDRRFRDPLLIGCSLMFFQQLTGQPSVLYYAAQIFETTGFSANDATTNTIWIGVLKIAATIVAVSKVDKWGRRPLLLGGVAGMTVALVGLWAGTSDVLSPYMDAQSQAYVSLGSLLLYVSCYQFSFGPMSWLICGEIFPLPVRGPAMALATMTNFSLNFAVSLALPAAQEGVGISNLYLAFAAVSLVALTTFYVAVPETAGKSLEQIEAMFDPEAAPPSAPDAPSMRAP